MDAKYHITYADIGTNGRILDGGVFKKYIRKPFTIINLPGPNRIFNYSLSTAQKQFLGTM